jgi:hypothetical protein
VYFTTTVNFIAILQYSVSAITIYLFTTLLQKCSAVPEYISTVRSKNLFSVSAGRVNSEMVARLFTLSCSFIFVFPF